ncbi:MAG TPA: hypothetical protein EYN04_08265 [Porticoccaceae bacterium]|nr:hypothetical protein [Porticoccaceae bacterium]
MTFRLTKIGSGNSWFYLALDLAFLLCRLAAKVGPGLRTECTLIAMGRQVISPLRDRNYCRPRVPRRTCLARENGSDFDRGNQADMSPPFSINFPRYKRSKIDEKRSALRILAAFIVAYCLQRQRNVGSGTGNDRPFS